MAHGPRTRSSPYGVALTLRPPLCHIRPMPRCGAYVAPEGVLEVIRALADPNRLRIFCALRRSERCVRDLVDSELLAQPLVSHHLRVLERAGLVTARRAQGYTLYAIDPAGMAGARATLSSLLDAGALSALALPGGNSDCCR